MSVVAETGPRVDGATTTAGRPPSRRPNEPLADRAASGHRSHRILAFAVAAVVVVVVASPIVAAALDLVGVEYRPGLDHAWIELRVFDVGGPDNPLVGPYSRIGANHPGPLVFYLLAPLYDVLGSSSAGLLSSAAVLNVLAVVGVAVVAFRRGGLVLLLLAGAATALLLYALGTPLLRDPWNPWLAVLPFLLFLLLAWSVSTGDLPMLPVATLVASFLVQTHLGYAVLVAYLTLWALGGLAAALGRAWRRGDAAEHDRIRRRLGWWTAASVAVAALCWSAPAYEQITGDPGNFTALRDSLEANDNEPIGFEEAGGYLARELTAVGPWSGAAGEADPVGRVQPSGLTAVALPAAAFVLALAAAAWARARDALLLQGTVAVAVAAGFLAIAMIDGTVHTYLVRWTWPIAAACWLSIAWSAYQAVPPERRAPVAWVAAPVLTVLIAALTLATIRERPVEATPNEVWSDQILGVEDAVFDALLALGDPEPVRVFSGDGSLDSYGVAVGLQLQLEKRGIDIVEPSGDESRYGKRRTSRKRRAEANVLVVSEDSITLLRQSPELDFVEAWNPRTPAEQDELTELDQLAERGELDAEQQARRAELRRMGQRIGVFIDPSP